jgi:hypothetical protein
MMMIMMANQTQEKMNEVDVIKIVELLHLLLMEMPFSLIELGVQLRDQLQVKLFLRRP